VVVLERGESVDGRVVAPDGSPVASAVVEAFRDGEPLVQASPFSGNQIWSDAEGRFQVRVPPTGAVDLRAFERILDDGTVVGGTLQGVRAGAGEVVLRLGAVEMGRTLKVTAVGPDGSPAPHVHVFAKVGDANVAGANARTDAEGRAVLERLPAARVTVVAAPLPESPGHGRWRRASERVEPSGQEVRIALREPLHVRGRVESPDRVPAAGATVFTVDRGRSSLAATADAEGRFDLEVEPDAGEVHVLANHGRRSGFLLLDRVPPEPVVLVLRP
jgi:hypothetical protein